MTNEADRLAPPRPGGDAPFVLRGTDSAAASARVRAWPFEPLVAQVVLFQQHRLPTLADLDQWATELRGRGYRVLRTGAVGPATAVRLEAAGLRMVQELVLLEHTDPRGHGAAGHRTCRVTAAGHAAAAEVDVATFAPGWRLDRGAVADVCRATPRHRARAVLDDAHAEHYLAYAVTGRDGRQGFLQRLAVRPEAQGRGFGRALVEDSLCWLARWRVQRVLVNTPTDNETALALYDRTGFHRLPERLRVYEWGLA